MQHWKILLTICGSLSCFLSILWALLWAQTLLALLRCCPSLFCWLWPSSFEMVQIPQMESFIPLARSCRKILTLSAISSLPKLSTTQWREKCPQIFHHEGPGSFAPPCPAAHYHLSVNFYWSSRLFSEFLSIAYYAPKITPRTGDWLVNKTRLQPSWNWSS